MIIQSLTVVLALCYAGFKGDNQQCIQKLVGSKYSGRMPALLLSRLPGF